MQFSIFTLKPLIPKLCFFFPIFFEMMQVFEETGYSLFISTSRLKMAHAMHTSLLKALGSSSTSGSASRQQQQQHFYLDVPRTNNCMSFDQIYHTIMDQICSSIASSNINSACFSILILDCFHQVILSPAISPSFSTISILHPESTRDIITTLSHSAVPDVLLVLAPDIFKVSSRPAV